MKKKVSKAYGHSKQSCLKDCLSCLKIHMYVVKVWDWINTNLRQVVESGNE